MNFQTRITKQNILQFKFYNLKKLNLNYEFIFIVRSLLTTSHFKHHNFKFFDTYKNKQVLQVFKILII